MLEVTEIILAETFWQLIIAKFGIFTRHLNETLIK
jgi:hypothetical protein